MRRSRALPALAFLGFLACTGAESEVVSPQDAHVEALRAYAKLYGYVRYFHPSDEAAELDWDRFAVYGAGEVLKAAGGSDSGAGAIDLRVTLDALFAPIAPAVEIYRKGQVPAAAPKPTAADTAGVEFVAWQHLGVGSGPMYKSIRLNRPNRLKTGYGGGFGGVVQSIDAEPYRGRRVRLEAVLRAEVAGPGNEGRMWLRVDRPNQTRGFFSNMGDQPVRSSEWAGAEITGPVADDAVVIVFGCFLAGSGTLWTDEFRLSVEGDDGNWTPIDMDNAGFEETAAGESPVGWGGRNPGYRYAATTENPHSGERSLRISHDPEAGTVPFVGRLFDWSPSPGEFVVKELGAGLWARIPVSLPSEDGATIPRADPGSIGELNRALDGLPAALSADDEAVRVGDVAIAWNVFQHFYPYFDVAPTDWDAELTRALESARTDETEADFLLTLRRLTAALHDGHAGVNHGALDAGLGHLPLSFAWVEGRVVVTASDVPAVQPGDILVSTDGVPAAEALAEKEALISGSPQWRRYRALLAIGRGEMSTPVQLVLERDGTPSEVSLERQSQMPPAEERPPQIGELEPGIWYVNLDAAPWPDIQENLDAIASAEGVVFDLRGYPKGNHEVISHLLTEPDTSSAWMRIPQVIYPDFELVTWEHASWGMMPEEPHIQGKVAFITDGRAISYAESFMGFIESYRLAEIVGQPTAGTNGNVNPFRVPGGYRVRFTGMLVVKHDGSQHHLIGIQPTVPAERTREGVREGRDELLERALELVR